MPLQDPILIYTAEDNTEAELVRVLLEQADLTACTIADQSLVGLWLFGTLPQFHHPEVWVERGQKDQAAALVKEYLASKENHYAGRPTAQNPNADRDVVCEACKHVNHFTIRQQGSVQACAHCGRYLDVGTSSWENNWSADVDEPPQEKPPE